MSTPNPTCLVNGSATPQDVTASASFTIALADATGVRSWTPTVVSTDETNTVAAVAATVVVNPVAKTATCTAPAAGSAVRFLSTVFDANGNVFTTTFVVNVLSAASTRVLALDESFEQDAVHGYLGKLNPILRSGGGGGGGGGGGQSPGTVVAGLNSNVNSGGATTLKLSGATGDFSIDGFDPVVAVPSGSTRVLTVINATTFNCTFIDQSSSASTSTNRLSLGRPTKVTPVLRTGSTSVFVRDSTSNFWTMLTAGYIEPNHLNPADFGLIDHNNSGDNAPAIQAAVNAAAADPGNRAVVIPRSPDVNVYYNCFTPIVNTTNGVTIRGEVRGVMLRPTGFIGVGCITSRPATTAPTPVQVGAFWGVPCTGTAVRCYLNTLSTCKLDGLTALTINWGWQSTAASTSGMFFSSHGRREQSLTATECLTAQLLTTGQITITFTTSSTGKQTFTSTLGNALALNAATQLRLTFDGHKMRLYINGNFDSASTNMSVAETLVQGYEDFVLFGQATDWPYGDLSTFSPTGVFYGTFEILAEALTTAETASAYVLPTSELTSPRDNNTMLMQNFDPANAPGQPWNGTASVNAAGMLGGKAQYGLMVFNGSTYLLWKTTAGTQGGQITIEDLTISGVEGQFGIWIDQAPSSAIRRVTTAGGIMGGLVLNDNSYLATVDDVYLTVADASLGKVPKHAAFLTKDGGPQDIRGVITVGGHLGLALVKGSGSVNGRSYCLPDGQAAIFQKNVGENSDWAIYAANPGDEGHTQSDAAMIFSNPSGSTQLRGTVDVTQNSANIVGHSTLWNTLGSSLTPGVSQVEFQSQPGVKYTVLSVTDDTHATLSIAYNGVTATGQTYTAPPGGFGGSVRVFGGQIQQTSSSGPAVIIDGGTEYVFDCQFWVGVNCPYAIKFLTAPDQAITIRGGQNNSFRGAPLPWMCETGTGLQGLILVDNIRGLTHHAPMPDANYTLPMRDFFGGTTLKFINGSGLTAGRTVLLPLVRGYERWIVNAAGQALTFQGATQGSPTGTGTTVTVPAGMKQLIACEDTSVGAGFTNWV